MLLADDFSCEVKWKVRDKSYRLPTCEMVLADGGGSLAVTMRGKGAKESFVIEGIRERPALDVLADHDMDGSPYGRWGRPFHDCLMLAYRDLGLDLGYIA